MSAIIGIMEKKDIAASIRDLMVGAEDLKLNLGCGGKTFDGLINIDLHSEYADVKMDALNLEYEDNSCGLVFASNLLEHFDRKENSQALQEWHRILRPDGLLILMLPNCQRIVDVYKDHMDVDVLWNSMMLMFFGIADGPGQLHKWGYAPEYLWHLVELNGFKVDVLYKDFPERPTPNMTIVARAIKNGGIAK